MRSTQAEQLLTHQEQEECNMSLVLHDQKVCPTCHTCPTCGKKAIDSDYPGQVLPWITFTSSGSGTPFNAYVGTPFYTTTSMGGDAS